MNFIYKVISRSHLSKDLEERGGQEDIWRKRDPDRGKSQSKGPGAGVCLPYVGGGEWVVWSEQGDWMLRDTVREGVGLGRVDGDILALIMFCPVKKKKVFL